MTKNEREIHRKLRICRYAEEIGQVAKPTSSKRPPTTTPLDEGTIIL